MFASAMANPDALKPASNNDQEKQANNTTKTLKCKKIKRKIQQKQLL